MIFAIGAQTDVGIMRRNNEDAFYVDREEGLFIIADGVGGHESGEVASRMAVETIPLSFRDALDRGRGVKEALSHSITATNARIIERSTRYAEFRGMGTTVVIAYIVDDIVWIAHVGDSRAYMITNNRIDQLTRDHTRVNEMVRTGFLSPTQARNHSLHNILTRALGVKPEVESETSSHRIFDSDILLLCSDGLTEMLAENDILNICVSSSDPDRICKRLIDSANDEGGKDNTTVIVVRACEAETSDIVHKFRAKRVKGA